MNASLRKELGWLSAKEMTVKEISTILYKSLSALAAHYLSDLFVRLSDLYTHMSQETLKMAMQYYVNSKWSKSTLLPSYKSLGQV